MEAASRYVGRTEVPEQNTIWDGVRQFQMCADLTQLPWPRARQMAFSGSVLALALAPPDQGPQNPCSLKAAGSARSSSTLARAVQGFRELEATRLKPPASGKQKRRPGLARRRAIFKGLLGAYY
jgi:hypothetical protein